MSLLLDLCTKVQTSLRARGCPVDVIVGPELTKPAAGWRDGRIVIEHDVDGSDSFDAPSLSENPKQRLTHSMAMRITIAAKSAVGAATVFEHRHRLMLLLHMFLVALEYVVKTAEDATPPGLGGFPWIPPSSGKWVTPEDLKSSEKPNGAFYELKWALPISVPDLSWTGEKQPTSELDGVTSMTKIHRGIADDDNNPLTVPAGAETACGA